MKTKRQLIEESTLALIKGEIEEMERIMETYATQEKEKEGVSFLLWCMHKYPNQYKRSSSDFKGFYDEGELYKIYLKEKEEGEN